jgi:thiopurine S-methyltransferase
MDHAFWHERWQQNQIGFHNKAVNSHLQSFWPILQTAQNRKVFVPLSGKTKDILWLLGQGCEVVAVELSPLAVQALFAENNLQPEVFQTECFTVNQIDGLRVYCGDFFQLTINELDVCNVVWDRASLVALPVNMREAYADHMQHLLNPGSQILLVAFNYHQTEMQGPPFSVNQQEVQVLYGSWCDVQLLCTEDILDREPHFRDRGLTSMQEQVYLLTVR